MAHGTYGWRTLAPRPESRKLYNDDGSHEVSAKIRTDGPMEGFTHLKIRRKGRWTQIVLDENFNLVAQGVGDRESDSYLQALAVMRAKGYATQDA